MITIATTVQDLHDDFAVIFMRRTGDALMIDDVSAGVHGAASREQPAFAIGRYAPGNHHRHAAFGTFGKIRRQLAVIIKTVFKPRMHRAHHHAVFKCSKAQIQRLK